MSRKWQEISKEALDEESIAYRSLGIYTPPSWDKTKLKVPLGNLGKDTDLPSLGDVLDDYDEPKKADYGKKVAKHV